MDFRHSRHRRHLGVNTVINILFTIRGKVCVLIITRYKTNGTNLGIYKRGYIVNKLFSTLLLAGLNLNPG